MRATLHTDVVVGVGRVDSTTATGSVGGEGKWAVAASAEDNYLRAGSSPSPIGTRRRIAAAVALNYI